MTIVSAGHRPYHPSMFGSERHVTLSLFLVETIGRWHLEGNFGERRLPFYVAVCSRYFNVGLVPENRLQYYGCVVPQLVSGSISIDSVDISKIELHDVRNPLSIIPQDATQCTWNLM